MKFTLGTLKAGRTPHVLDVCSDDERLVQWANAAQERLMNCGRWWGTVVRAKFCVSDNCLVWPREVATIERVTLCNTPISQGNLWYEFTEFVNPYCEDCCWRTDPRLIALSNAPTVAELDEGKNVIALATHADDVGKYIIVQGNDENNAWVRTDDAGTVIDGEKILLAVSPGTASTTTFNNITAIQKEDTDYDVLLYQYDADTGDTEQLLGRYQPNEAYPDYRRSVIRSIDYGCCSQTDCDNPVYTVEAICSLQHVPVAGDGDFFVLQNEHALQLAMQAIKLEEVDKDAEAEMKWRKAIRELQRQAEKYTPSTQSRIITSGFGTAHPAKLFNGFI